MKPGAMPISLASLYQSAYGVTDTEATDDNISGFMTGEWRLSSVTNRELTASHSVRSPGINERYVARITVKDTWIGNPGLETELGWTNGTWSTTGKLARGRRSQDPDSRLRLLSGTVPLVNSSVRLIL
ncbi:hypothetical protein [Marinobacter sp.]|uniref:hypothetical protein n=1 Tax=Marinobacter sp. TaxID=50741 RepID=UPI00384D0F70